MRSINLQMDGDQICATWDSFESFVTDPAGFGDNITTAISQLIENTPAYELNGIVTSIENSPRKTLELAATVPAVAAANNARVKICPCCDGHGTLGTYMFRNPPEAKICSSCNGMGKLSPVA